jgi:hypothetical protein
MIVHFSLVLFDQFKPSSLPHVQALVVRIDVTQCVGDRCGTAINDEDQGSSRRHGVEDRGWSSIGQVLCGRTIERSGDTVCILHYEQGDEERGFLGLASKQRLTVSPGLASKSMFTLHVIWPQNHSLGFHSLGLKTGSCSLVIWPTKSPQWFLSLGPKIKWAIVCQLRHKIDGSIKMARDTC